MLLLGRAKSLAGGRRLTARPANSESAKKAAGARKRRRSMEDLMATCDVCGNDL